MYKHYSPNAKIQIIQDLEVLDLYMNVKNKIMAFILTDETIDNNRSKLNNLPNNFHIISW
jgi:hypothetical protein